MFIVTGGAGFIGSAVVWRLNREGIDDILVVDDLGTGEKWKNLRGLRFAEYVSRDEFLPRLEAGAFGRLEGVAHMGACSDTTERDAEFLMRNNVAYSRRVCRAALKQDARFVHASSASVYGDGARGFDDDPACMGAYTPLNMYAYSKYLFDMQLLREGLLDRVASLRFFNVYGPNEYHKGRMRSMVCKGWEEIRRGGRMRLFKSDHPDYPDGGQMRDFIYVKDCAEVVRRFLEPGRPGGIYNVGTGRARSWNDLAHAVFAALERPAAIDYVDMPDDLRGKYQNFTQAAAGRLERSGCLPRLHSLEDGIRDYVREYLEQPNPYLSL